MRSSFGSLADGWTLFQEKAIIGEGEKGRKTYTQFISHCNKVWLRMPQVHVNPSKVIWGIHHFRRKTQGLLAPVIGHDNSNSQMR